MDNREALLANREFDQRILLPVTSLRANLYHLFVGVFA
jgi:hypothetical protein